MPDLKRRQQDLQEISRRLENGVRDYFYSDKYRDYLRFTARMHDYSWQNCLLLKMQRPDISYAAGYSTWKALGRHVRAGEKGLAVICPAPVKVWRKQPLSDGQGNPILDENGTRQLQYQQVTIPSFKVVARTFAYEQTEGPEIPGLFIGELQGGDDRTRELIDAMVKVCPVPVSFEEISGSSKGYFNRLTNRVVVKEGMDPVMQLKTLTHEVCHSIVDGKDTDRLLDRRSREVRAESVAFVVLSHEGIATDDYSFPYIARWSADQSLQELKDTLESIQKTSADIISQLDREMERDRNVTSTEEASTDRSMDVISISCDKAMERGLHL